MVSTRDVLVVRERRGGEEVGRGRREENVSKGEGGKYDKKRKEWRRTKKREGKVVERRNNRNFSEEMKTRREGKRQNFPFPQTKQKEKKKEKEKGKEKEKKKKELINKPQIKTIPRHNQLLWMKKSFSKLNFLFSFCVGGGRGVRLPPKNVGKERL